MTANPADRRDPIVIVGATATGKSSVAMALAAIDPTVELVSADSMQVYRGMDIGTAKPTAEEQAQVRHHVIDVVDPHEDFGVAQFQAAANAAIADIERRGGRPVLVGGTGLYVRAVVDALEIPGLFPEIKAELEATPDTRSMHARLESLDPVAAGRMEATNRRRVIRALEVCLGTGRPFSSFGPGMVKYPEVPFQQIGIDRTRPDIDERIAARYEQQMESGFLAEVRALADAPMAMSPTARQALGYKELLLHLEDGEPLWWTLDLANQRTRRFARRQQRWFRRDPRILWLDAAAGPLALAQQIHTGHFTSQWKGESST